MTISGAIRVRWSTGRLAAGRAVEEDPDGEVRRKVLEPVRLPGRREQEGTRSDGVARGTVEEPGGSAGDDVDLVPVVGLLRIMSNRRVQLDRQRPMGVDR